jgi:hypothetical protein
MWGCFGFAQGLGELDGGNVTEIHQGSRAETFQIVGFGSQN